MRKVVAAQVWHPVDVEVQGSSSHGNPFSAEIKGIFSGPGGERILVPGFYAGEGRWKVRFSPTAPGSWRYRLLSPHIEISDPEGQIRASANRNRSLHGGVTVDADNPHHFRFQDGTPLFVMAYEADWLWALSYGEPDIPDVRRLVDTVRRYRFNQIIMNLYAHDTTWCPGNSSALDYGPPPAFCWEGTNESPDHSRMNLAFFEHYDRVMSYLLEAGMTVHLFLRVYNKGVNWPANGSPDDDLYYRYVTARYQAYPNVLWDFSKEAKNEPDKEYIADRIRQIRAADGYGRLVTVHDDILYFSEKKHLHTMDFLTIQQHDEFYAFAIAERGKRRWPIFNSEFGYEHGPGGPQDLTYRIGQSGEELVDRAWQVVMAGAYPAYYYTYTAWDVIDQGYVPPGYGYFRILYEFFADLEWWRLEPYHAFPRDRGRALAIPGREYVLYSTQAEWNVVYLDLADGRLEKAAVTWVDTRTGRRIRSRRGIERRAAGDRRFRITAPFTDSPWACRISAG